MVMLSTYGMVCNILLFTYVAFQPFIKLRFCVNDTQRGQSWRDATKF